MRRYKAKHSGIKIGAGGGIRTHEGLRHRISPEPDLSQAPPPLFQGRVLPLWPDTRPRDRFAATLLFDGSREPPRTEQELYNRSPIKTSRCGFLQTAISSRYSDLGGSSGYFRLVFGMNAITGMILLVFCWYWANCG